MKSHGQWGGINSDKEVKFQIGKRTLEKPWLGLCHQSCDVWMSNDFLKVTGQGPGNTYFRI